MTGDPPLDVVLSLPRPLPPHALLDLQMRVAAEFAEVAGTLGLHLDPVVAVMSSPAEHRVVAIYVDGVRRRYDVAAETLALARFAGVNDGGADRETEVDAVVALVRSALTADPAALVGDLQAQAWCDHAGVPASTEFIAALRAVVRQGQSVRDAPAIAALLSQAFIQDPCHPAEALASLLRHDPLVIRLAPEYLRRLPASTDLVTAAELLERLNADLGLPLPPLQLRPDPALRGTAVRIRVNDLDVVEFSGLPPEQSGLVGTPDLLRAALPEVSGGQQILLPTGRPGVAVDSSDRDRVQAAGYPTFTAMDLILSWLDNAVRRFASRLLDCSTVTREVEQIGEAFPVLVKHAMSSGCLGELTALLARLLAEHCPIRDVVTILQTYAQWSIGGDDSGGELAAAVRRALGARLTSSEMPRGSLMAYLLDGKLEDAVVRAASPVTAAGQELTDHLLHALHTELAMLPRDSTTPPNLVTTASCRLAIQDMISIELPQVRVLAYDELPGDLLVRRVARISLPS